MGGWGERQGAGERLAPARADRLAPPTRPHAPAPRNSRDEALPSPRSLYPIRTASN